MSLINSGITVKNIDFRDFAASKCRLVRELQKSTLVRRPWLRRQFDLVKYSSAIYIAVVSGLFVLWFPYL